ncbi:MAG: hypothetical protein HQL54_06125 [Magnetococcales bacterium]|nr:hypothetical protein [Magnetococcales bacterium]
MHKRTQSGRWLLGAALFLFMAIANTGYAEQPGKVTFSEDVFPILKYRCLECHAAGGPGTVLSGLDLETYEGLMKGTKYGPIITPGNAMVSNLNVLVEGRAGIRMPHNRKRLTKCEVQILRDWVNQGAKNN